MIKTFPGEVPSNITVRLRKMSIAVTIRNSFFSINTDALLTLSCRSNGLGSVTRNGKGERVDQVFLDGFIQEFLMINLKE